MYTTCHPNLEFTYRYATKYTWFALPASSCSRNILQSAPKTIAFPDTFCRYIPITPILWWSKFSRIMTLVRVTYILYIYNIYIYIYIYNYIPFVLSQGTKRPKSCRNACESLGEVNDYLKNQCFVASINAAITDDNISKATIHQIELFQNFDTLRCYFLKHTKVNFFQQCHGPERPH